MCQSQPCGGPWHRAATRFEEPAVQNEKMRRKVRRILVSLILQPKIAVLRRKRGAPWVLDEVGRRGLDPQHFNNLVKRLHDTLFLA